MRIIMQGVCTMQEQKIAKTIQSVHRALDIWEFLIDSGNGFTLSTIAEKCGLNKTTAFHLLKTLESRGYVEQSFDTQFYKIGWKSYEISTKIFDTGIFLQAGKPYLEQLSDEFNETSFLCQYCKIDGHYESLCQYQIESSNPLHTIAPIGTRMPLHCTAAGKIYLTGLCEDMFDKVFGEGALIAFTENTITDKSILHKQVSKIKKDGFCIEREEFQTGVCTIAVPVVKYTGRIIFSLVMSMPTQRATEERLAKMVEIMKPMAKSLSNLPL